MEYGLWQDTFIIYLHISNVLILVLMEYGLWRDTIAKELDNKAS